MITALSSRYEYLECFIFEQLLYQQFLQGMLPGSYLVEVDSPEYVYEAVRIDINSKGKHRARKNNPVQPNQVSYSLVLDIW